MSGRLEVLFELNISDVAAKGRKAGKDFSTGFIDEINKTMGGGFGKSFGSTFFKNNSHLIQSPINPPGEASGPRGILKLLSMGPLFQPSAIQGLRDVVGKDLAKVLSMGPLIPPGVIRGLKEQTGKDLAKVLSMPDITSFDKQPTNWKQGILGALLGLRHPYVGARMMNEAGFFGGGGGAGGKGGMLGGLLGGGNAGFEKAFIAIEAVKLSAEGLKIAFEHLKESFEQGFRLFTESSRLGIKSGELFNREFAAKAIGVSVADIEKYMLRTQWGKARTSLQNFGAGSSIRNMQDMFNDMIESGQRLIPILNRTSGEFYRVGFSAIKLNREWDAMLALMGEQMTGVVQDFIDSLQELFQMMNSGDISSGIGYELSAVLEMFETIAVGIEAIVASFLLGIEIIGKAVASMVVGIMEGLNKIPGFSKLTGHQFDNLSVKDIWTGTGDSAQQTQNLWKRFFGGSKTGPTNGVDQQGHAAGGGFKMPIQGAWERMGYVIGSAKRESKTDHILGQILGTLKSIQKDGKNMKSNGNRTGLGGIVGQQFSPA